jgi:AcrR family transcriptional regulator
MTSSTATGGGLRRDAQRNLDAVMEAALELFAQRGVDVSIAEIAARAGVGKATVYRSFPTKDDLLDAVALRRIAWFQERMDVAGAEPDAWAAFESLVLDIAARMQRDQTLGAVLRPTYTRPAVKAAKDACLQPLEPLMRRAIEQGAMRADAEPLDLATIMAGYGYAMADERASPQRWLRFAQLMVDTFRARPGS